MPALSGWESCIVSIFVAQNQKEGKKCDRGWIQPHLSRILSFISFILEVGSVEDKWAGWLPLFT